MTLKVSYKLESFERWPVRRYPSTAAGYQSFAWCKDMVEILKSQETMCQDRKTPLQRKRGR